MSSTWMGISTALSALRTQRVAIDVAGQNIANVNTPGYARQRVQLTAGIGVEITSIQRLYSGILGSRARTEDAQLQDFTVASTSLQQIEQVFPEPSPMGFQSKLDALWSGFADVARDPSNRAARIQVIAQATDAATWLNNAATELQDIAATHRAQLESLVETVNGYAEQLANLNIAISQSVPGTVTANTLLDQRTAMAQQLAQAVGGSYTLDDANMMSVSLGGGTLVTPRSFATLQVSSSGGDTVLQWTHDSSPATVLSGAANGHLTAINTTIPAWMTSLDGVADALATKVNSQHTAGWDANGAQGKPLFTGTTASTIALNTAITNGSMIAASSAAPPSTDGLNADALSMLATASGGPDALYRELVVSLGLDVQAAQQAASTQEAMAFNITSQIDAESGVNIDEEMANLLTYQRAYEAAARVLTAIDSVLDTLVNRTGVVGR